MLDVLISLIPAFAASIIIFGFRAALVVLVCVATCVLCEWVYQKSMKKPVTIGDCSAAITGVLLAFNLPSTIPLWQAVFGGAVAIILIKQLFGGLGKNFANPAVTARIVMFLAFSVTMTTWVLPLNGVTGATPIVSPDGVTGATPLALLDGVTGATPLALLDGVTGATPLALLARGETGALPGLLNMFLGLRGGCLGETSALALLLGGVYLVIRRVITWHTPVAYIATVFIFTALFGLDPVYHVLSGGLILGAVFMATDYVTTPQTGPGKLVFGVGAGLLTVVFRVYGSFPEGVSFAILLMNIVTPYINRFTATKSLGGIRE